MEIWTKPRGFLKTDFAFRLACGYGHLNVAQWLIDLSKDTETYGGPIDIHAFSDFAFRVACYHGHFDIARWLIPFGGMPAIALKKDHLIRKFYLNRFPAIGLLSLYFRRFLYGFRERFYCPPGCGSDSLRTSGGKGYVFAKKNDLK